MRVTGLSPSNPRVRNERTVFENGKTVLIADTSIKLDCCDPSFSLWARDQVEGDQHRVARRFGFDEVRLNQI